MRSPQERFRRDSERLVKRLDKPLFASHQDLRGGGHPEHGITLQFTKITHPEVSADSVMLSYGPVRILVGFRRKEALSVINELDRMVGNVNCQSHLRKTIKGTPRTYEA